MTVKTVNDYISNIQHSLDGIVKTVEGLSEEVIRWNPSEDEWSILQILNHVKEATPYWLGEVDRVLEKPGSDWGRGLDNPARLEAVTEPEKLDVSEVIQGVANLKNEVEERLSKVDEARLTEENPHRNFAKFGNKPVSFIIEHFIEEHVEGHLGQINRNLNKWNNK